MTFDPPFITGTTGQYQHLNGELGNLELTALRRQQLLNAPHG